jgi:hypothetical protein
MDNVRVPKDIKTQVVNGVEMVILGSGGISTSSTQRGSKNEWELRSGYEYDNRLFVNNDHDDHYLWEPKVDMTLVQFIALLQAVNPHFRKSGADQLPPK